MERRDFISNIGQAVAFVCAGSLLNACSKSSSAPATPKLPFTVDLSSELLTTGSSYVNGSIVVVRVSEENAASSFDALSLICTHEGCGMNYRQNEQDLYCACHGSKFDLDGNVLQGPATRPVTKYNVTLNNTTLTIG